MKTHCRLCGTALQTQAGQVIGVCTTCIQFGGGRVVIPPPPGYGWNPMDAGRTEPPRPE